MPKVSFELQTYQCPFPLKEVIQTTNIVEYAFEHFLQLQFEYITSLINLPLDSFLEGACPFPCLILNTDKIPN